MSSLVEGLRGWEDTDTVYIKKVELKEGVVVGLRAGKNRKEAKPRREKVSGAVSDPCRDVAAWREVKTGSGFGVRTWGMGEH